MKEIKTLSVDVLFEEMQMIMSRLDKHYIGNIEKKQLLKRLRLLSEELENKIIP